MTDISWTEQTWNPIVGCSIESTGCKNCYAMTMANRLQAMDNPALAHYKGTVKTVNGNPVWTGKVAQAPESTLHKPFKRKKPTMYFVNSMSDLFHEDIPYDWITEIFKVMRDTPQHTYQILTKRSKNMREYMIDFPYVLPNVWLGVSAENQEQANIRIPDLLGTPAAVRFVSVEPQLEHINLISYMGGRAYKCKCERSWHKTESGRLSLIGNNAFCDMCGTQAKIFPTLDQVIQGSESGPKARPWKDIWAMSMRDQCAETSTPYFLKQSIDENGKLDRSQILDGVKHDAMPGVKL